MPRTLPTPNRPELLGFPRVIGLFWLDFHLLSCLCWAQGWGGIMPSVTLRGQAILGGHIFQGVRYDLLKHKKKNLLCSDSLITWGGNISKIYVWG